MKYPRFLILLFVLLGCMVVTSCDLNRVFEDYTQIPNHKWDRENIVSFNVNIIDTIHPHNIFVDVRNSGKYNKSDLWLFIQTTSPSGEILRDTFNCVLADETGRWFGSGFGDIYDSQFLLRKDVIFPRSGTYVFEYEQAMRDKVISGISDVGLRVERSE